MDTLESKKKKINYHNMSLIIAYFYIHNPDVIPNEGERFLPKESPTYVSIRLLGMAPVEDECFVNIAWLAE